MFIIQIYYIIIIIIVGIVASDIGPGEWTETTVERDKMSLTQDLCICSHACWPP